MGFNERVYEAVKAIPAGRVSTYGWVAAMAGNPRAARAVGWALRRNPDPSNIPCHRIVNREGRLTGAFAFGGMDEQKRRLEREGVVVTDDRVDLRIYGI